MNPLRIGLLKPSFHSSGGLEKYCGRIALALEQKGHSVTILSTAAHPAFPVKKICRRLRPSALNLVWFDYHCRRYLQSHQVDVVFGFDRHFLSLTHYRAGNGCHRAYLARRAKEASFLRRLSFLVNPLHRLTLFSERRTFEKSPPRFIICNSHLVERELVAYYPEIPAARIKVINNGVEWQELAPHFERKKAAAIGPRAFPELLCIGHEWKRKGVDRLLHALGLMREVPFHLTVVGRERHPELFTTLARTSGIDGKVTFVPTDQKPMEYYQKAQIAIIPSRYDPFANVTLEALAMGLFVITTAANGGSEVITPNLNGIVLGENPSPHELEQAIRLAVKAIQDPHFPYILR